MGLGRLVPVSLGLALLFTVLGGAMVYLDSVFEEVPDFLWYVIFAPLALVLRLLPFTLTSQSEFVAFKSALRKVCRYDARVFADNDTR